MPQSKQRKKQARRPYVPTPEKKKPKASPRWYGVLILGVMLAGVFSIVLNYMGIMPGGTHPFWLWVGLGLIAAGFGGATRWR